MKKIRWIAVTAATALSPILMNPAFADTPSGDAPPAGQCRSPR
jgi:hypothetical protein